MMRSALGKQVSELGRQDGRETETDALAYMSIPPQHRAKLHSTNPIERVNGEIKRRTDVVGIFPNGKPPGTSSPSLVGLLGSFVSPNESRIRPVSAASKLRDAEIRVPVAV
jgi:hypothetical protein